LSDFTPQQVWAYYGANVPGLKKYGSQLRGPCPIHQGDRESLSIDAEKGLWTCHAGCGEGNIITFEEKFTGRRGIEAFNAIRELTGDIANSDRPAKKEHKWKFVCSYDYLNRDGSLLFQVVRYEDELHPGEKTFKQRRPDPDNPGKHISGLGAIKPVLYRLPEVVAAETVVVVEGEKDADNLRGLGFVATTSPMGAKKWQAEYTEALAGKHVVIMPDKDPAGEEHVKQIISTVYTRAASVKLVYPAKGKDASDWIKAGAMKEDIERAIQNAEPYRPPVSGPAANNASLEQTILSCVLRDPDRFDDANELLKTKDFSERQHKLIFSAMKAASDIGPPDLVTVWAQLEASGNTKTVPREILDGLAAMTDGDPKKVRSYCKQLKEFTFRRTVAKAANEVASLAKSATSSKELAGKVEELIGPLTTEQMPDRVLLNLEETITDLGVNGYQKLLNPFFGEKVIATPWAKLNEIIIGFKRKTINVIAARPSVGKSVCAGQIALHAARNGSRPGYFTLEMPKEGVYRRMICDTASVQSYRIIKDLMDEDEKQRVMEATEGIMGLPLYVSDQYGRSVRQLKAAIRNHPGGLDIAIIDYFQLMKAQGNFRDRRVELTEVSIQMKQLAVDLEIPIVLIASINRESVKADREPQMSDLYECGQLEYDSDMILMLHRPNIGKPDGDASETKMLVRKNRDGQTGKCDLHFNRDFVRFEDISS
jgi:replicative DNA helicase